MASPDRPHTTGGTVSPPMTSQAPYFSVVIPTYNRAPMLLRVLDSLASQNGAPALEVIVVNDGSKDDTEQLVDEWRAAHPEVFPFTFVTQANSGPARARNRGVTLASGRYVLFIGDDTVPDRRFLAEHERVHRDNGGDPWVACLGYTGWPANERVSAFMDYINDYGLQFGYALIRDGETVPFNFFYTSNISVDRELLAGHPFDTTFPAAAWEDIELAYRLEQKGLKIIYNSSARTEHYHPTTVASFARRQYTVGRSGAIFYEKHPELGHMLGVHELPQKAAAPRAKMKALEFAARLGERFRPLARPGVFETLMREHYLQGLREGLQERTQGAES